jgi:4-amino-4-deoxy-L-arabinose transferase-like glycosyltransferase
MLKKISINLEKENWIQYAVGFFCLFTYAGSLLFPLMDKDAAHHANIALHMYKQNDYASLIDRGKDYLDKPHFLFWCSLLSFKIFGINTFAHRLPALLFALVSIYSTYKLARHLSDKTAAKLAALMLATAQAFILSITDARMETPLTAGIMLGMWQLIMYVDKRNFIHLLLAVLGTAIAFSTKGWIGPVIIFTAVFFHILLSRQWSVLLLPRTWLFIPMVFVFISPVLYAYYLQYDLHPEKVIRGESHRSGVGFILWDQLFERAKGFDEGGRYKNYFFLYHTFLWAFFPWSIIAYVALLYWLRRIFVKRKWRHPFNFAALSFGLLLFLISFSKFKMPHYVIMLLPLAALFTSPYLTAVLSFKKGIRIFFPLQFFFAAAVVPVTLLLNYYFFKPYNFFVWTIGSAILIVFVWLLFKRFSNRGIKLIGISAGLSLLFNFFMNYNFFPNLLKYQAGKELADSMKKQNIIIPDNEIMLIESNSHSFDFYRNHIHPVVDPEKFAEQFPAIKDKYFLVNKSLRDYVQAKGFETEIIISQRDYNVATVKLSFLNPATRAANFDSLLLVKFHRR